MALPDLEEATGALPPGVHEASFDELATDERFSSTYRRRMLLEGLRRVVEALLERGIVDIWIDGSFVTDKPRPRDVDVVYGLPPGTDPSRWGDVLSPVRRSQLKERTGVDLLTQYSVGRDAGGSPSPILTYFQTDRQGRRKGIVKLVEEESL